MKGPEPPQDPLKAEKHEEAAEVRWSDEEEEVDWARLISGSSIIQSRAQKPETSPTFASNGLDPNPEGDPGSSADQKLKYLNLKQTGEIKLIY